MCAWFIPNCPTADTVGRIINMMCGSLSSVTVLSAEGGLEVGIVKEVPPCWVVELYWLTSAQRGWSVLPPENSKVWVVNCHINKNTYIYIHLSSENVFQCFIQAFGCNVCSMKFSHFHHSPATPSEFLLYLIYELRTGCTSQVSWIKFPVTAGLFTLFCLITSKYLFDFKRKARI